MCSSTKFVCLPTSHLSLPKLFIIYSLLICTMYKISDVCARFKKETILLLCILSQINRLMFWAMQSMYFYKILCALPYFNQFISQFKLFVWANSGRQWSTEKPCMMQSMGSQRVGQYLVSEQQGTSSNGESWTNLESKVLCLILSCTSCMNLYGSNLISLRPSFINKMSKKHLPHKIVLRNNWNNACKSYL